MKSITPLLSILIATKNRQKYCLSAVESILSIKSSAIEVVVQDNSDDQSLKSILSSFFNDTRLIYRYTPPPFSSIDNFNAALELASGEYVCLIGDDDGINPEIIKVAKWAKENDIDSVTGSINANYRWDGTGAPDTLFSKMTGSTLTITHFTGKARFIDLNDSFDKLMKNGATNYLNFDFPKFYHGIVKKSLFDHIKVLTGAYIKGLSPDIYTALSLAIFSKRSVAIDYPLTIPGVCGQSTSISEGQLKKHSKRIEDAPHMRDRMIPYQWEALVPRIYCVQAIWADSGFAALREFEKIDVIKKFNKYRLFANIVDADKSLKNMVFEHMLQVKGDNSVIMELLKYYYAYCNGPIKYFISKRVLGRLKKILKLEEFEIIHELEDMSAVSNYLSAYLKNKKIDCIQQLDEVLLK